jgi:outer membrane biosynthesis protein TonB
VVPPSESSPDEVEPPPPIPPAETEPEVPPVGSEPTVPVADPASDPPPPTGVDSPVESVPPHAPPRPAPVPDAYPGGPAPPAFADVLASLSLLGSSSSNDTSRDLPAQPGGGTKAPASSGDIPGKRDLPGGPTGPSAPSPAPAGAAGGSGSGFFFAGFAALVAAISFGVARRSSGRLTSSVAVWHPVALVSLPERPG